MREWSSQEPKAREEKRERDQGLQERQPRGRETRVCENKKNKKDTVKRDKNKKYDVQARQRAVERGDMTTDNKVTRGDAMGTSEGRPF
jgi:hypothetical protein